MTELLYLDSHEGSYLKEFEATVIDSRQGPEGTFIELDRSAFYPLGGGQPSDKGELRWEGGTARVKQVRQKHRVRHFIQEAPVKEGERLLPETGSSLHGTLDWNRRYAHMRMHTAQHLVSAVVDELHGAATVGNQIGERRSRIDFAPLRLDAQQLEELQGTVNRHLLTDLPLTIRTMDRADLEGNPLVRANLDRLPPHLRRLRVIAIGDIDLCPCAGTHVRSLAEIGSVRFTKRDSKGAGKQRLTYQLE